MSARLTRYYTVNFPSNHVEMVDKFDETTQKELAEFLEKQQAQARMSSQIQSFTVQCWDKCVTGTPSTRFSRSEETCLANCVDRFLDTSLFMVKQIEEKRIQSGR